MLTLLDLTIMYNNPQINDHRDWMTSYDLTETDIQQLDAFYDAWEESSTLPDLNDYLDIDSIIL